MTIATLRIASVSPDPLDRDARRPWLISTEVIEVHAGEVPGHVLDLLVHSPVRSFRDPEPVGKIFTITMPEPVVSPYAGLFSLVRAEASGES